MWRSDSNSEPDAWAKRNPEETGALGRKKKEIVVSHILGSFFNGGKRGKYQNSC